MKREQFGKAYESGYGKTVRHLQARGATRDTATEVAQAAWARAWERISQLRNEGRLLQWINSIASHLLVDGSRRRTAVGLEQAKRVPVAALPNIAAEIDVSRALQDCKPRQRQLLREMYWQGYSTGELAKRTRKSPIAISTALSRARRVVRQHLDRTAA